MMTSAERTQTPLEPTNADEDASNTKVLDSLSVANNGTSETKFWNVNVPPELQTKDCPDFLQYAFTNDKDRRILSTPDAQYRPQTWDQVQQFIRRNRLDLFERLPSDLRRYRKYCAKLEREYGTVMEFVMQERLRWTDLTPKREPFTEPGLYLLCSSA